MKTIRRLRARIAGIFSTRRSEQDDRMEQEFREHIELQTADFMRAGMPEEEARRKALLKFGPMEALKEDYRDQRGMPVLERFYKDLRQALRTLRQEPGFALFTTLMLGIGLAGAVTIFSLVDGILIRPLPYRQPERLVTIGEKHQLAKYDFPFRLVSAYHFIQWRKQCRSLEDIALIQGLAATITGLGEPERVDAAAVSPRFFPMLGIHPVIGRSFTGEEEQEGKNSVVILSDHFWRSKLDADPQALGRTIHVNGRAATVIGILGPEFRHPQVNASIERKDLYMPKAFDKIDLAERQGRFNYDAIARLKPGVAIDQAVGELQASLNRIGQEEGENLNIQTSLLPLSDAISGKIRQELLLLLSAVGILVIIICVNLANLLLARGERRTREFGIRAALGAGRMRLVTHALTEAMILAAGGAITALALSCGAIRLLASMSSLGIPRLAEVSLDGRVAVFAFALAALTCLLFGLMPALRAGRINPQTALQSGGRSIADSKSGLRTRSLLVGFEVGLCLPLLILAGLLVNSFIRLIAADKGFTAPAVLSVPIKPVLEKYKDPAALDGFYKNLFAHLESAPGVASAAIVSQPPLKGEMWIEYVATVPDAPEEAMTSTNTRFISADYFRTMGIPLHSGRTINDNDRERKVAVISARLGALLWPEQNPVGRRFNRGNSQWFEVIGVAGDVRADPEKPPVPILYRPYWDWPQYNATLAARSKGDPQSIRSALGAAIRATDPEVPVPEMQTMEEVLDERIVTRKFEMYLAGAFASIALIVAGLGLYAVVSYTVARRTSEIGVRCALGAKMVHIYRLVIGQGFKPVASGLMAGLLLALAGERQLADMLYEVSAHDAWTIGGSVCLLAFVSIIACWIPARRAAGIDPLTAIKYE